MAETNHSPIKMARAKLIRRWLSLGLSCCMKADIDHLMAALAKRKKAVPTYSPRRKILRDSTEMVWNDFPKPSEAAMERDMHWPR